MGFGSVGKTLSAAERVAEEVSREFTGQGIRHAIVGGLAVAAHGYPRSTADVDLLVLDSSRVQGHPIGIPGVGFVRDGIPVDVLFIGATEGFLREAVLSGEGVPPVLPLPALIYLKLKASRAKDFGDVVELLKVDTGRIEPAREWLVRYTPFWVRGRFENAVKAARAELKEQE